MQDRPKASATTTTSRSKNRPRYAMTRSISTSTSLSRVSIPQFPRDAYACARASATRAVPNAVHRWGSHAFPSAKPRDRGGRDGSARTFGLTAPSRPRWGDLGWMVDGWIDHAMRARVPCHGAVLCHGAGSAHRPPGGDSWKEALGVNDLVVFFLIVLAVKFAVTEFR